MDFNTDETALILNILPPEIQLMFFEHLDIKAVLNASEVNYLWHDLAKIISRQFIDRYFPYCKITKSEERAHNPFKLLADECLYYKNNHRYAPLGGNMSLILAALSGNNDIIKAEQIPLKKIWAYGLFFANGNLSVLQYLLNTVGKEISAYYKKCALRTATFHQHFDIIQALNGFNLRMAAVQGNLEEIKALLTNQKPGQAISPKDKEIALIMAAQYGHMDSVALLLKETGHEISLEFQQDALEILKNTLDNNNVSLKTEIINQLQINICCQRLQETCITPHYNHHLLLTNRHDDADSTSLNLHIANHFRSLKHD